MLDISNISVSYEGSRILRGVNLSVPDRSLVCLMGRNGVGKTTTLKSIMGLVRTDEGTVKFDGNRTYTVAPGTAGAPRPRLCAAGPGHFSQPDRLGESENQPGRSSAAKANEQVDRVLGLFPVLKEMLHRKGGVLSGGQQQQLAIARALLTGPEDSAAGRADRGHSAQYH